MKSRIILPLLFILSYSITIHAKTMEVIIKTNIYCDHCNECGSCKERIEHELSFEKGIKVVKLNVEKQEVLIKFNPSKTNVESIRMALNKIGFDADHQVATPEHVSKLDDCCQKSAK